MPLRAAGESVAALPVRPKTPRHGRVKDTATGRFVYEVQSTGVENLLVNLGVLGSPELVLYSTTLFTDYSTFYPPQPLPPPAPFLPSV